MYEDEDTSWSFGIGLFIGALAGAAVASLFTPRSGAQNREVVLEKGVVLKERVSGATSSVTASVKDTTSSAVTSVKDATNTAVTKVSDTVSTVKEKATAAAETVTETASSAVSTVSETASSTVVKLQNAASTAAERVSDVAGTATEKVSSVASTATEKVSTVASTAAERVSDVASTATEKARELTGRTQETAATSATPDTRSVVSEANYDAEDRRPATTGALRDTPSTSGGKSTGTSSLSGAAASVEPLQVLSSLETFEPTMADVTASTTIDPTAFDLGETATGISTADTYNAQFGGTTITPAELRSDEQFEITDTELDQQQQNAVNASTTAGTNADVGEASEGAERGA